METWLTLAAVGAVTFLMRASFIVFTDPQRFPRLFRQALAFVPPAVLAAMVIPGLVAPLGTIDVTLANPRWMAGVLAILVAWRTKNVLATTVAGMAALWLLQGSMG